MDYCRSFLISQYYLRISIKGCAISIRNAICFSLLLMNLGYDGKPRRTRHNKEKTKKLGWLVEWGLMAQSPFWNMLCQPKNLGKKSFFMNTVCIYHVTLFPAMFNSFDILFIVRTTKFLKIAINHRLHLSLLTNRLPHTHFSSFEKSNFPRG